MKNLRHLILAILTILPIVLMGTPIINAPTIKNGTCKNNATITVKISDAGTNVTYGLKGKAAQIAEIKSQLSNVFTDLPAGDYIISVYDNTTGSIPVIREATVTTTYVDFKLTEPEVIQDICGGSIRLRVTGGSTPYLYRIRNIDTNEQKEFSSYSTTYLFNNLEPGKYYSEIIDNCGEIRVAQANEKTTIREGALSNVTFETFEYKVGSYIQGNGSCNSVRFSIYYSQYFINGSSTIATTHQGKISYRVEYPVGSGIYTPWDSGQGYHYMNNYNINAPGKYRVEVKHPCTGVITKSPEYNMPQAVLGFTTYNYYKYNDFCTIPSEAVIRLNLSTSGITSYICDGYQITVTPKSGGATRQFTWNNSSSYFDMLGFTTGTTYTITISSGGLLLKSFDHTISTPTSYAYSPIYMRNNAYNYGKGNFNTTEVYANRTGSSAYSTNENTPITYTILSGPTTARPPITLSSNSTNTLWTDLPYGTYTININYNNCRSEIITLVLTQVVTGFDAIEPIITPGATCGAYDLKLKGYFLNMNGLPYTTSGSYYQYNVKITNLDKNNTYNYNYINSNSEATSLTSLEPGSRYKIQYYAAYNNGSPSTHYYKEQIITIPKYQAPSLHIPLSGGITCGNEQGTLTLTAKGDRPPFLYRYKNYIENDDPTSSVGFGNWTSQNVFTGLQAGRFSVQISNSCGDVTRENVKIYSGTEQFVTLIGSFNENTICQGKSGLISVLSIGPVNSYQWYKNDVKIIGATAESYTIPDMQLEDEGVYKVVVGTDACQLSSEIRVRMLGMLTTRNDSATVLPFEQRIIDVYANDSIALCQPEVCDQILTPDKIQVEGHEAGVLEGTFGKIEIVNNKIKYTAPEFYKNGVVRFTYSVSCIDNGTPYDGEGSVAIFILQSCTQPTVCYAEGFNVCFNDYPTGKTRFDIWDKDGLVTLPKIYNSLLADEVLKVTPIVDNENFPTINFNIHVIPKEPTKVRWKGTTDHYWNNAKNWVTIKSNGTDGDPINWVPNDCVDAEIPTASPRYPKLSTEASINNLFMKDRAMLAYSHKLAYRYVELDLNLSTSERDRWIMYSSPLKHMYTGDFMLRKNTTKILENVVFMSFFQATNPDDRSSAKAKTITRTFGNLEQELPLGKSFFMKMHTNSDNINKYTFPRSESKYAYYNVNNWSVKHPSTMETESLTRTVQGRFIADVDNINIDNTFSVTPKDNMQNSEVIIVSNPFPAYLNIKKFLQVNNTVLEQGYLIWDGTENTLMKYNKGRGNTWTIQDINLIKNNTPSETEYIAPFQSFFVVKKVKDSNPSLIYKPEEMTTVEPIGISGDYILK